MKTIFLDESGCLGFKLSSSTHFSITLLCCEHTDLKRLRNIPKRIRERKLKKRYKNCSELKANNTNDIIRKAVLKKIDKLDVEIYTIIIDKKKVYDYLKERKHILYNYITQLILNECTFDGNSVDLIVDRRGGRTLSQGFTDYIRTKFTEKNDGCKIQIEHKNSNKDGGLQMVDFVSWAIFRKYEHDEDVFYNIIEDKITIEKKFP